MGSLPLRIGLGLCLGCLVPATALAQTVRVRGPASSPAEAPDSSSDGSSRDPAAAALTPPPTQDDGLTKTERIWLEIGTGVLMTGGIGAGAFLFGQAHDDGCDAPCEVDSVFLAASVGLGVATLLVPLTVTLTGNWSGEDGDFGDTVLGYITGLAVAIVFSSMGSSGGGDAFLYPAAVLASTIPLAGAILAFEASSMRPVGGRSSLLD